MTELKRQLTLWDGIALGIGSIMGSGILFLPALTYQIAGPDAMTAWILTTVLCLPIVVMFADMVKAVPSEHGVAGFLRLGLGQHIAAGLPILLLGTVVIGMPSAAIIASRYVSRYTGWGVAVELSVALGLIGIAIFTNIAGVKIGSAFQRLVAGLLFIMGCALLLAGRSDVASQLVVPEANWDMDRILMASVISFWAYAGFENMTFMAGEFKRPKRDLVIAILVSLVCCGWLYIGLTAKTIAVVPMAALNESVGLYQLAEFGGLGESIKLLVVLFAVVSVLVNLISWSWGLSRMVFATAGDGQLPRYLHQLSIHKIPVRALMLLGIIFAASAVVLTFNPLLFKDGLQIVSCNFVFVYLLCSISYAIYAESKFKKICATILSLLLIWGLSPSGFLVLYPVCLTGLAALTSLMRSKMIGEVA